MKGGGLLGIAAVAAALCLTTAAHAAAETLPVEGGATYRVTLSFENASADEVIERVGLAVRENPPWVERLRISGDGIGPLPPRAERRFTLEFGVAAGAAAGASGEVVLELEVPDDTFVDHTAYNVALVVADRPTSGASLEGAEYVLAEALDDSGQPIQAAGWAERPNDFEQTSLSFDAPQRILIGEAVSFAASVRHSSDCARSARQARGARAGFLRSRFAASVEIRAGSDPQAPDHFWSARERVECARSSGSLEYAGGTQTVSSAVNVTWTPSPDGDRSRARYTATGEWADGWDQVFLRPTGVIAVRIAGNGRAVTLVYRRRADRPPIALAAFSHPLLPSPVEAPDAAGGGAAQPGDPAIPAARTMEQRTDLIDEWLGIAEPPQNATEGADLRYDPWGRLVGTTRTGTITAVGPPDSAAPTPHEHVWARRDELDSVDHCTLAEYVGARLAAASIDPCRGRYRRPAPPDVVGLQLGEAAQRLRDAGFEPAPALGPAAPSAELAGTVALAGVPHRDRVDLEVYSDAPAAVAVPDLSRLSLRDAAARLVSLGLQMTPELGEAAPSSDLAGSVYGQDPAAASHVEAGTRIRVTVYGDAAAPPTTASGGGPARDAARPSSPAVPDLSGLTLPEAQERLESAGLAMRPELGEPAPDAGRARRIYRQSPDPGSTPDPGAPVTVWVYAEAGAPPAAPAVAGPAGPLLELQVPSRIGAYEPMLVRFSDRSSWGRSQGMLVSRLVPAATFGTSGGATVIPRPGDRWPFEISPLPFGEKPYRYVFAGPARVHVSYGRSGTIRAGSAPRRDVGPHFHVFWLSSGLRDRWEEYRALYPFLDEIVAGCNADAVSFERPGQGWENGYLRVASTTRSAFVYMEWDDNDLAGGLTAEVLEQAARTILDQIEPLALACVERR